MKTPGYEQYNSDETLNFMLNRLAWDIDPHRLQALGKRANSIESFIQVMLEQAQHEERNNNLLEAGFFYRAAEFFMPPEHELKRSAYEKFMEYFYKTYPQAKRQYSELDYGGGKLGLLDIPAKGPQRDVILFCSGFDGLIEELYGVGLTLASEGYRVILFEGPGQGSALRRHGLPMVHNWEAPVSAILDHFSIASCTLGGISLGGYLAPRAAAFDKRIKRLFAWGAMYDWTDSIKAGMGHSVKGKIIYTLVALGFARLISFMVGAIAKKDAKAQWGLKHGLHTLGVNTPYEFLKQSTQYRLQPVVNRIQQDTLVLMGENDHLVPAEQMSEFASALVGARSVTTRWLTAKEKGAEHCQIGNPDLVVQQILLWLDGLEKRDLILNA